MNKKRERTNEIMFGHNEKFDGVKYDNAGKTYLHLLSGEWVQPDHNYTELTYLKDKGSKKYIHRINGASVLDIHFFLSAFDVVFAIYTNTKVIHDRHISVSGFKRLITKKLSDQQVEIFVEGNNAFLFCDVLGGHAEKYAWRSLVEGIIRHPDYSENQKICIITDHDMSNHSRYNSGGVPIYGGFALPKNIQLVYATGDVGGNFLNKLIRSCDDHATEIVKNLELKRVIKIGEREISIDSIPDVSNQ